MQVIESTPPVPQSIAATTQLPANRLIAWISLMRQHQCKRLLSIQTVNIAQARKHGGSKTFAPSIAVTAQIKTTTTFAHEHEHRVLQFRKQKTINQRSK